MNGKWLDERVGIKSLAANSQYWPCKTGLRGALPEKFDGKTAFELKIQS